MAFISPTRSALALAVAISLWSCTLVHQDRPPVHRAAGSFEVQVSQQSEEALPDGSELGRATLEKRFLGDIDGVAHGEMLTAVTSVAGSAGYVAIERVVGTVHGRRGSFLLQHNGVMTRGTPQLSISIVPDSGTDDLAGITGTMRISIGENGHTYEFDYTFEEAHPD